MKVIAKEELRLAGGFHPDLVGSVPIPNSKFDQYGLPKGLCVKRQKIGIWDMLTCGQPIVMTHNEVEQSLESLRHCRKTFAGGMKKTLIQKLFGVHSAYFRIDYFNPENLGVQVCEVEERPAGIYVTSVLNRRFREPLTKLFTGIERAFGKPLAFCVSEGRANDSDDADFVRHFRWGKGMEGGFEPVNCPLIYGVPPDEMIKKYVWWVRALRSEEAYYALEPHAITTISQEGNKEYGVHMGLWFPIPSNWKRILPLQTGVVLKPGEGSRFEHSLIIRMNDLRTSAKKHRRNAGVHGLRDAERAIESGTVKYWQPYYPPEQPKMLAGTSYRLLRRAYYGFDFEKDDFFPMGGLWAAHNTDRIHGTSNTLFGPLFLPESKQ
jgi:hypothetical protein